MYQNPYDQFDEKQNNGFQLSPPDPRRPAQIRQTQNQANASAYDPARAAAELARTQQQIQSQPLQNESTRTSIDSNRQGILSAEQQRLLARQQAEQQYGEKFRNRPESQTFSTIAGQYASALSAAKMGNKAADLDLVNAFAKILDPPSVVREGEVRNASDVGGTQEKVKAYLSSIEGSGSLTPAQRDEIVGQVRNRASKAADIYRLFRQQAGDAARQYGYDPERALGPNPAQPFQQLEADYFGHPIKNGNSFVQPGGGPRNRGAPGGGPLDPEGIGDIGFNQSAQGLPPGAQDAQRDMQTRIASGQFKTGQDLLDYAKRTYGFEDSLEHANAVIQSVSKGGGFSVATPRYRPDIKDSRGSKEADARLGMQQQMLSGMPMGGIVQGMGQLLGPQKADAFVRGAADVPTFGMSEEIGAGINTVLGGGTMQQNLANQNAIRDFDKQNNFGARFSGQVLGGFALPTNIPGAARGAGANALRGGLGRVEALAAAGRAGAAQAGREGALYGGGYGLGSTDGNALDRVEGGVLGAGAGALGGYALGRTAGMFGARSRAAGSAERNALGGAAQGGSADQIAAAQAAQALNIDMPRFVAGGRTAQRLGAFFDQTPLGAPVIGTAQDRMIAQSQAAKNGIAERVGTAFQPEAMGERAGVAGNGFVRRSSRQARNLYSQAEREAEGVAVPPQAVMQTLSGLIREQSQVPAGTRALPVLQRYAQAFENGGPISIQGAREMRTELRASLIKDGDVSPPNADRLVNQVMDSVTTDITNALTGAGRQGAVRAYRQADDFWRQRSEVINDVIKPYIGRDGENWGADVAKRIVGDAKGNSARLASLLNNLEPQEANEIRATLIDRLGRATKGQQNAEGDGFSLDTFLTNYDEVRQAAPHIFGAETNRDLRRLAAVAERAKAAGRAKNHSNTGTIIAGVTTLTPAVSGAMSAAATGSVTTAIVGFLATAAQALAQYGGAHLLVAPGFAQRLAQTAANPRAARGIWSDRAVAQMVRSSPALASDISGFRASMLRAMNDNVGHSAAASDDEEQKRRRRY